MCEVKLRDGIMRKHSVLFGGRRLIIVSPNLLKHVSEDQINAI